MMCHKDTQKALWSPASFSFSFTVVLGHGMDAHARGWLPGAHCQAKATQRHLPAITHSDSQIFLDYLKTAISDALK